MTDQNLIIDGVDHAKFDLEWAKHGGCCIFDDSTDVYKQLILGKQVEERFIGARFFFRDHWVKLFCYFENYPTRMATPAECEAAGIEYIARPTSEQCLTDLQRRTQAAERYAEKLRGVFHVNMLKAYPQKSHQEISDEIDNAMKEVK